MARNADDIRDDLERQVAELKREIARIGKSLSARTSDAMEDAGEVYEEGRHRARRAVRQVREQSHVAADIARENPGTTLTVLATVGLLGLAAGLSLGSICASGERR